MGWGLGVQQQALPGTRPMAWSVTSIKKLDKQRLCRGDIMLPTGKLGMSGVISIFWF